MGKTRNAGQVCTSPTRFIVQAGIHDAFVRELGKALGTVKVGAGLDPSSQMGALANERRLLAVGELIEDAVGGGGRLVSGGGRTQTKGYFMQPAVVADVPATAKAMRIEPFGPVALVSRFGTLEEGLAEANRLPYGLAAYAFTTSAATAVAVSDELQSGTVGINSFAVSQIEAPFGGVKDSGYGKEGGHESLEAFMQPKYVHHVA
jgi:succinate-semialdehyde dehydrogenase/glutarate-semialdehyde dehydrogenase